MCSTRAEEHPCGIQCFSNDVLYLHCSAYALRPTDPNSRASNQSYPVPGDSCCASSWKPPHPSLNRPLPGLLCCPVVHRWDPSCHSSLSTLLSSCVFQVFIPLVRLNSSGAVPSRALHRNNVPIALSTATQVVNRCCLEGRKE